MPRFAPLPLARRVGAGALTVGVAAGLVLASTGSAAAAAPVSQATAQAVHANVAGLLALNVSSTPTTSANDGTGSNDATVGAPLVSALTGQSLLAAGALKEVTEANTDGSSYGCAGVVSPGGGIQVGATGQTCDVTGNSKGGVTLDLGQLPGLGTALAAAGDIKITVDAVTANGYQSGTGTPVLDANVANVTAQLGSGTPVTVNVPSGKNQDLLSAVLGALTPQLGALGTTVSQAITNLVSIQTNYQPNASTVTGLHLALLGTTAVVDLATVTVGPNVQVAGADAFSFASLPLILGALAVLVALVIATRTGVRRVRARI